MIGQVGEKLAAPAMSIVAGSMGKDGMLNAGQQQGPASLPPLGSQPPVKLGGLDVGQPPQQQPRQPPQRQEGVSLGVPQSASALLSYSASSRFLF